MAIFQKSVLNKFIKSQDSSKIDIAYQKFSEIFLQADRQAEIRSMKEEEYQDGFLDDLFVNILGYVKRPNTGYNLVREKKNEADSKKADGAILKNDLPLAVIELKGTDTTDLDKVTEQGFGYKNNHKECVYVVTSNFEKLRFFIHNAVEFIEFNLFKLSKEDFITLWLCLYADNLLDNIPAKIKSESIVKEEDITKNLYKDYSSFKQELWQNIVALNPNGDPLMFYKKTQKLIDRFLFIFFAEDAGLLPPNSISRMVDRWKMLKDEDAYKPLYDIFKQYFGYINTGRPGKTPQDEIFAYNGGLMLEDDVLESISIDDDILLKHVSKLTSYDFSSEVDVNILGHIFENSLNDIEAVTAELEGQEIDKSKTKRKKDGVFYTPKYITKYIVENTIGKLCQEKKIELNIIDEEYAKGRTHHKKENLKKLDQNLQDYRNWLLQITICDPACGSGAFLNQALEFLMEEHQYIDELESKLLGSGFKFPGVENHILENNIFGVDINEESVEIAKLSLWLRTAQRGRKLTSLNNNLKCGNSLIDEPEVAGEKAFNWQIEFPTVFEKGGFDVVIGNPPYVQVFDLALKSALESKYDCFKRNNDLYSSFYELSINLLKFNGVIGFITPNSFIKGDYFKNLRLFFTQFQIDSIVDFNNELIFQDANVFSAILILEKKSPLQDWILKSNLYDVKGIIKNGSVEFIPFNPIMSKFIDKPTLDDYFLIKDVGFNYWSVGGEKTRGNSIGDRVLYKGERINEQDIPYTKGSNFNRYTEIENENFLRYNYREYLNSNDTFRFSEDLLKRSPKLIYRQTSSCLIATIDYDKNYCDKTVHIIVPKENVEFDLRYLLAIFNSKLYDYLYKQLTEESGRAFAQVKTINIKKLPFILSNYNSNNLEKIDEILSLNKQFKAHIKKLTKYILSQYQIQKITGKLIDWYNLDFSDFLIELNKAIKSIKGTPLSKKDEFEWMEIFDENKNKALDIKSKIDKIENEINQMVNELFGLTDEEIQIVENS
jgi:type I restriction-modification system DNA methylase subunit